MTDALYIDTKGSTTMAATAITPVRLNPEDRARLEKLARADGQTLSGYLRRLIRQADRTQAKAA
jgi:hypothetical protein